MARGRRPQPLPDDPPPGTALATSGRADIWSDPFYAPTELPQRMSSEELLAWYSYIIRDETVPLKTRLEAATTFAAMLKLTGPAHVTNVLNHTSQTTVSAVSMEEARALVERLGNRFRNLPAPAMPTLPPHSTATSRTPSLSGEPSTSSGPAPIYLTSSDRTK